MTSVPLPKPQDEKDDFDPAELNDNNNSDDSKPQFYDDVAKADPVSRRHFIKKVYIILFSQLCVTALIGFGLYKGTRESEFIQEHGMYLYLACFIGAIVCICTLSCCSHVVRAFPRNYMFLSAITFFLSMLVGFSSARFQASDIAVAVGITAALFIVLTIFAVVVKKDFTGMGMYLFIALIVLLLFGLVVFAFGAFTNDDGTYRILRIILSVVGVIVFSFYIIYDTQQIVGGENRKFTYSTDEHVFAAISLYFDLINMFSCLLSLVGMS